MLDYVCLINFRIIILIRIVIIFVIIIPKNLEFFSHSCSASDVYHLKTHYFQQAFLTSSHLP